MSDQTDKKKINTLDQRLNAVKGAMTPQEYFSLVQSGQKRFENVFQAVSRMILDGEGKISKKVVNGKPMLDYNIFRDGKKHVVGMYDELNQFVSFVKDAADGGSSKEMAFVLVGEPGNGKTFFVEYLCDKYRDFLSMPENRKFTFRFNGLSNLEDCGYNNLNKIVSQTFEDPMILALNMFPDRKDNIKFMENLGFSQKQIEEFYDKQHRSLGADSDYILTQIRDWTNGNVEDMLKFVDIIPVPMSENLGTVTGKYQAKDKITSSAVDLIGEEDIKRTLRINDDDHPFLFNVRRGALARVGGGGIHFSDEIFKNKKDLVQVYLGVIQNRHIEIDGRKWPLDTLIVGTSNNDEFNKFLGERSEAPMIDRCRIVYVGHCTNYKEGQELVSYALGDQEDCISVLGEKLHHDPNLKYALSVAATMTRLPKSKKLTPIEMMKLAAGESAGEKSVKTLAEVVDELLYAPDVTQRFGQSGLSQRSIGRTIQGIKESFEAIEGGCLYAEDAFKAMKRVIIDEYVHDEGKRKLFIERVDLAKTLYRERIRTEIFDAYMDEPLAIQKDVMNYINMIIGMSSESLGSDKVWRYKDPQTGEMKRIQVDERYINNVEHRLGLNNNEQRESFRRTLRGLYGEKLQTDPNYDFMDNLDLVKAVTDVRLHSDVAGAGSLVGALANRANEENQKLYNRMISTMRNKLGYCETCAQKTIEYFCRQEDQT